MNHSNIKHNINNSNNNNNNNTNNNNNNNNSINNNNNNNNNNNDNDITIGPPERNRPSELQTYDISQYMFILVCLISLIL